MRITGFGVGSRPVTGLVHVLGKRADVELRISDLLNRPSKGGPEELHDFESAKALIVSKFNSGIEAARDPGLKDILAAQKALLEDEELSEMLKSSTQRGLSAARSIVAAFSEFVDLLSDSADEFKERIADLHELEQRLLSALAGIDQEFEIPTDGSWIVVSEDLTPLETSKFTGSIVGVITSKGGPTSHTAIVCRQLGIPALVGCIDVSEIESGMKLLLDPIAGQAKLYEVDEEIRVDAWWSRHPLLEVATFSVSANVGSVADAKKAAMALASGVGLLRSELALLSLNELPDIDKQRDIYREILEHCPAGEVIFRTLDAGTDKPLPFLDLAREENPALGVRGQRIQRIHPAFFNDQLIALKEAAQGLDHLKLSVMAPMIATRSEAKDFALSTRDLGFDSVGIMVEVPSIIDELPYLERDIDFISIGTNDLSQYLFAADRQNSLIAELLDPWQPALLKAIERICLNAGAIKVGVCGEAASDPLLATVLFGLGVNSLSSGLGSLSEVAEVGRRISPAQCRAAALAALAASDARQARISALEALN